MQAGEGGGRGPAGSAPAREPQLSPQEKEAIGIVERLFKGSLAGFSRPAPAAPPAQAAPAALLSPEVADSPDRAPLPEDDRAAYSPYADEHEISE